MPYAKDFIHRLFRLQRVLLWHICPQVNFPYSVAPPGFYFGGQQPMPPPPPPGAPLPLLTFLNTYNRF